MALKIKAAATFVEQKKSTLWICGIPNKDIGYVGDKNPFDVSGVWDRLPECLQY